jgi:Zn-dependent protease with chaperone function
MMSHEFFHEQVHIEKHHELKRGIFLFGICSFFLLALYLYRIFCHFQEFEADRLAAEKCGRVSALESLKFLRMREGKVGFFANLFSLHPRTENRLKAL